MSTKWVVFALIVGIVAAEPPPYRPRGWRPSGRVFNPASSGSHGALPSLSNSYGSPIPPALTINRVPSTTTAAPPTTTEPATTTTTTTPKTREPTTPFAEDEFATGPALAVANSFAFNRPVYVYNGYPFYSGYTLLK